MSARTIHFQPAESPPQACSKTRPLLGWQGSDPVFPEVALYGVAGDIVRKLEPYTEADPAALYFQLLTCIGSMIGSCAHFEVEGDRHAANLFLVVVGKSAKARKGTSWGRIFSLLAKVDSRWWEERQASGLSSGEGLIFQVRDAMSGKDGEPVGGIEDKRLLIFEGEFAQVLRVLKREGNTLSGVIRNAWDGKVLASLTKNAPIQATGAHISIVAHVTNEELQKEIRETAEMFNGFANRFLWCFAKRSKLIPESEPTPEGYLLREVERLREAVAFGKTCGRMERDDEAKALWKVAYTGPLALAPGGLLGGATCRGEAQVVRLSAILALLDCSRVIQARHLRAALYCWEYCGESAKAIFGDRLPDPVLQKINEALKARPEGFTRTEFLQKVFLNNCSADKLSSALHQMEEAGLIRRQSKQGERGAVDYWIPTSPFKMNELNEVSG
jgi:hypothetical protein